MRKKTTTPGWIRIKLGEYLKELSERHNTSSNSDTPVLSVTNRRGFVASEEFFDKKVFSKDLSNYKVVHKGQFAYNPSRVNVGSISRLKEFDKGLLSPMYVVFEAMDGLDGLYLHYWISSQRFRNLVKASTQGSVRDSLNFSALAEFPFVLPPEVEQRKIVSILACVDSVIDKTQAIIDQTQTLKKGLTQELFTRGIPGRHKKFKKTKIGEIPEEWGVVKLKEIAKVFYGLGQPPSLDSKGVPMVRATNIKEGEIFTENLIKIDEKLIPPSKNVYLKKDDILVVRSGAYTGDIGYVDKNIEGCIAGYDLIVRIGKYILAKYLVYYLLSPTIQEGYFKTCKSRSAQPHLNSNEVEMAKIPLAPVDEQKKICNLLSEIEKYIRIEKHKINQIINLKSALMQVLLTGKVRVKV